MSYVTVPKACQIGRVGELLTEAILEQNYFKCCRVNHEGFDLLAFDDDGNSYRVEVKSASAPSNKAGTSYRFMTSKGSKSKKMYTHKDTDLIVFAALDIRRIVVKCVTNVIHKRTTIQTSEFEKSEALQISRAIAEVRKRKC